MTCDLHEYVIEVPMHATYRCTASDPEEARRMAMWWWAHRPGSAEADLLEVAKRVRWLLAQKRYPGIERDEAAILGEAEAAIAKAKGEQGVSVPAMSFPEDFITREVESTK